MLKICNIKKRYIIAFLITVFILFVSKGFWLVQSPKIAFDFYIFTIILICSYLLSLKLTEYLAEFKDIKNKSRIEIVFLATFFIFLFIPMSNINPDIKSKAENRVLTVYKPLFKSDYKINYNFGNDFNSWFNDRFFGRCSLIALNPNYISRNNDINVIFGQNGWLFYKGQNSINNYQNIDLFTKKELKQITNRLNKINSYCKKKNKKFYFFIAPAKNTIYGENYPKFILKPKNNKKSRTKQLISYLNKHSDIKVIYPAEDLINHKKDALLYYKNDTHWNPYGAYIGYKKLIEEIDRDFKGIESKKEIKYYKEYHKKGDLYNLLFYKPQEDKYKYKGIKIKKYYKMTGDNSKREDLHSERNIKSPKATIYRDSFASSMLPFLANDFSEANYYWRDNYRVVDSEIKDSDIVILEITERLLPRLLNIPFDIKE